MHRIAWMSFVVIALGAKSLGWQPWQASEQEAPILRGKALHLEQGGGSIHLRIDDRGIGRLTMRSSSGISFDIIVADKVLLEAKRKSGVAFRVRPDAQGRFMVSCTKGRAGAYLGRLVEQNGIGAVNDSGRITFLLGSNDTLQSQLLLANKQGRPALIASTAGGHGQIRLLDAQQRGQVRIGVEADRTRYLRIHNREGKAVAGATCSQEAINLMLRDPTLKKQVRWTLGRTTPPVFTVDR